MRGVTDKSRLSVVAYSQGPAVLRPHTRRRPVPALALVVVFALAWLLSWGIS